MIRIGIIGAGNNATEHARYYHECDRTRVIAVADPVTERARALADLCGAKWVGDYRQMLGEVDAVVVASPNQFHKEQMLTCARAGRHVYCEKPVGLCGADARAMADAAAAADVRSAVGFSVRNSPAIRTLARLVERGDLGRLTSIWSRRLMALPADHLKGWRADPRVSGGLLLEINIHEIDWMMMLGGSVREVYARTACTRTAGERANDHLWVTLSFADGAVGLHEGSWASALPNFFRGAHGDAGGAQTDEWGQHLRFAAMGQNMVPVDLDPPFDLRAAFLDAIETGQACACDLAWGAAVMGVADAIFASAAEGRPVRLPAIAVRPLSPSPRAAGVA